MKTKPDTPQGVWFERRHHLALAWLIRFGRQNRQMMVSGIPAFRAQFLASPASRETVKSRIPSIYLSFSRFPHRILVKSRIPKIPFQTLEYSDWWLRILAICSSTMTAQWLVCPCCTRKKDFESFKMTVLFDFLNYIYSTIASLSSDSQNRAVLQSFHESLHSFVKMLLTNSQFFQFKTLKYHNFHAFHCL